MCTGLTRGPPPPFFGSVHSKGVAGADSGSAHSKGHTGRSVSSRRFGARKKLRRGATESDAIFYRGKWKEKSMEGQQKSAGTGIPALRVVYGSLFVKR